MKSEPVEELEIGGQTLRVGQRVRVPLRDGTSIQGKIALLKTSGWVGVKDGDTQHEGFFGRHVVILEDEL